MPPDVERLAAHLEVLASPTRLELLRMLRTPQALGDLHLAPRGPARGGLHISRPAVRKHLRRLQQAGLLHHRPTRRDRTVKEYFLNHAMLFAIVEELRSITELRPDVQGEPLPTMKSPDETPWTATRGTRLIVVHGATEGRTFALASSSRATAGWSVGRRPDNDVALDYDPYISQVHARIHHAAEGYLVEDVGTNRNGTRLNWQTLSKGGRARLVTGDVVGVGRTLLLFRAD